MKNETSAERRKRERLLKKIYELIKDKKAVFLTMSFNEETLKKTSAETRKRYIKNYLKNETALYIANIDYGAKQGREHYHAIVKATTLKINDLSYYLKNRYEKIKDFINLKAYKYGNIQANFICKNGVFFNDIELKKTALIYYNHALKETTKNNKLIISRKEPSQEQQIKRLERLTRATEIKQKDIDIEETINEETNQDLYINIYDAYALKYK